MHNQFKKTFSGLGEFFVKYSDLGCLFIFAVCVRGSIAVRSDNIDGYIALERVFNALDIVQHPFAIENIRAAFGPVHPYLMAFCLWLWPDSIWTPRLISILAGALLVFPFYHLIQRVIDRDTAFFSTLLLVVYPPHVVKSVVSMPAVLFQFFVILSLWLIVRSCEVRTYRQRDLFIAGISLGLACLTRYEGLVLVPLFIWFTEGQKVRDRLIFSMPVFIMIFAWGMINWIRYEDPLFFVHMSDRACRKEIIQLVASGIRPLSDYYTNAIRSIIAVPYELLKSMPLLIGLLGIGGLLSCVWQRKYRVLWMPPLFLYVVFTWKLCDKTWVLQMRYISILGIFLIPFAVQTLTVVLKKCARTVQWGMMCVVITPLMVLSTMVIVTLTPHVPDFAKKTAVWLHHNARKDEKILLDHDRLQAFQNNILLLSSLPHEQFYSVHSVYKGGGKVDTLWLKTLLEHGGIKYIVYSPEGAFLAPVLQFSPEVNTAEAWSGYLFTMRFYERGTADEGSFAIYEIEKMNGTTE